MRVGFTGTRHGMTNAQLLEVHMLLGDMQSEPMQGIHGMCQGADQQFHLLARALGYFMIGHPGVSIDGYPRERASVQCDDVHPPKYYLHRNRDIVDQSDILIATPKLAEEQRTGTWYTIRYARKVGKPLIIVWPDGSSVVERVPGVQTVDEYRAGRGK